MATTIKEFERVSTPTENLAGSSPPDRDPPAPARTPATATAAGPHGHQQILRRDRPGGTGDHPVLINFPHDFSDLGSLRIVYRNQPRLWRHDNFFGTVLQVEDLQELLDDVQVVGVALDDQCIQTRVGE